MRGRMVVVLRVEHRAARKREREMKELVGMAAEPGTRTFCALGNIRCALGRADMRERRRLSRRVRPREMVTGQSCGRVGVAGGLSRCVRRAERRPGRGERRGVVLCESLHGLRPKTGFNRGSLFSLMQAPDEENARWCGNAVSARAD